MSLREKINKQFNTALKSQNKTLISTLRLVLAAIKERDIANRSGENKLGVKDAEIVKVLLRMKKQLNSVTCLQQNCKIQKCIPNLIKYELC